MTGGLRTIGKGFRWLWDHWYIPVFAIAAAAAWFLRFRHDDPLEATRDELQAISQRERIRRVSVERGAELANAIANAEYHRTLQRLDSAQKKKADALRHNPARRVRYLRRMSKRIRKRNRSASGSSDYTLE